jgi:predicted peptidase
MRSFILSLTCFFLFFTVKAQPVNLFEKFLYKSDNGILPYRLLEPVNHQSQTLFPLVIFLHGAGERGTDNEAQLKHIDGLFLNVHNREKYPCYVVAPQCPEGQMWAVFRGGEISAEPAPPMKLVIGLIDKIIRDFPIDTSRVYLTGLSMGGFGTWDLLARFPHKFAAAVPICGGGDQHTASKIKDIPLWAFHGAKDDVVSVNQSRRMVKALQNEGGLPGYTEYPDVGHNSWVHAYREPHLLPWLFSQKLPANYTSN